MKLIMIREDKAMYLEVKDVKRATARTQATHRYYRV